MSDQTALHRLRDPEDPALGELADLLAAHVAGRTVADLVEPELLAGIVHEAITAVASAEGARDAWIRRVDQERARLAHETRTLRDLVPAPAHEPVRTILSTRWTPSEALAYDVLDHPAMRTLLREVLQQTLQRFVQGARAVDDGVLGGLAGRVARGGKGLLGGIAGRAEGLASGLRDEVFKVFEDRIGGFLGSATDEALHAMARWLADDRHAEPMAAMRVSLLDLALDRPIHQVLAEVESVQTADVVDALLEGLRAAAEDPALRPRLERDLATARDTFGDESLDAWLEELGLREAWTRTVREILLPVLRDAVNDEAFGTWWTALHA